MTEKFQSTSDSNLNLDMRLLKIEKDFEMLEYKLKKEIPKDLADRMIVIEQRLEAIKFEVSKYDLGRKFGYIDNEIEVLKKEVSAEKSRTKERIAFIAIIVSLVTYLVSLLLQGGN